MWHSQSCLLFPLCAFPMVALSIPRVLMTTATKNNLFSILTILFSAGESHLMLWGHPEFSTCKMELTLKPFLLPLFLLWWVSHLSFLLPLPLFPYCFSLGIPFSSHPPFVSSVSVVTHAIFLKHIYDFVIPLFKKHSMVFCWKTQLFRYYTTPL